MASGDRTPMKTTEVLQGNVRFAKLRTTDEIGQMAGSSPFCTTLRRVRMTAMWGQSRPSMSCAMCLS